MLSENNLSQSDVTYLANIIDVLTKNFDRLDKSRQLTTLNLVMKLAFLRDAREIIIPPMDDLKDENPDSIKTKNKAKQKHKKFRKPA